MRCRNAKKANIIGAAPGNWSEASSYFKVHPYRWRILLNAVGMTALTNYFSRKVDALYGQRRFGKLQGRREHGLFLAAITGNVKIAEILFCFGKNPRLLWIRDQNHMLPIQLASSAGHILMTEFLFRKTSEDLQNKLPFPDIVKLFFFTINNNIYSKLMHISFAYLAVICYYDAIFLLRMLFFT